MNAQSAIAIQALIRAESDEAQKKILSRFFKTGSGEYGEGDLFQGVRVPRVRQFVKQFRATSGMDDVRFLVNSIYHEERLAGFLLLIEIYKRAKRSRKPEEVRFIIDSYLSMLDRGNNWDLVDLVAPKILGDYVVDNPGESGLLFELARMDGSLWHQRVAMVSTWSVIRAGRYCDALALAEMFLTHKHDLMHKASGWMLREVGKRGGMKELLSFLGRFAAVMPRTMLRYAIEKLPEEQRRYYMGLKQAEA